VNTLPLQPHKSVKHISWLAGFMVFALACGCFALSFTALRDLAAHNGVDPSLAWIWPAILDGSIIVFSLCALRSTLYDESPIRPMILVIGASLGSIAFNVAHAPEGPLARLIASVPPTLLFFSFELLVSQIRSEVRRTAQMAVMQAEHAQRASGYYEDDGYGHGYGAPAAAPQGHYEEDEGDVALANRQMTPVADTNTGNGNGMGGFGNILLEPKVARSEMRSDEQRDRVTLAKDGEVEDYQGGSEAAPTQVAQETATQQQAPARQEKKSSRKSQQEKINLRRMSVKKLVESGASISEIAKSLGVVNQTVRRDMEALGLA